MLSVSYAGNLCPIRPSNRIDGYYNGSGAFDGPPRFISSDRNSHLKASFQVLFECQIKGCRQTAQ